MVPTPLCLGNITKEFSEDNKKKAGLNKYVYDFSVDYDTIAVADVLDIYDFSVNYDAIAVADILDIHKCLMKKNKIV